MTIPLTKFEGLYIGSRWIRPDGGGHEPVINPANEEVIGEAPVGGVAEAEGAIAAARQAFDRGAWSEMPQAERTAIMRRMHAALQARAGEIKELMIVEGGVTRMLTDSMHFGPPMNLVERLLDRSAVPATRQLPVETALNPFNPTGPKLIGSGVVVREPVGVVTAITPYNAPFLVNISKVFSALLLGEIADEIGLPAGVLNVVTGGNEVGVMLTSDPRVDMITFTGSETVGATIMAQAAPTLKKLLLELGGKSALIVREDADVQKAAMEGLFQISTHCGQGCALATRHLVHNKVRPAYIEMMKALVGQLTLGDPAEATTVVGPLIRGGARDRVERMVAQGKAEGAKLVFGGGRPEHLKKGFFYNVTVFDDVDNAMSIAQDEIFGPVAAVIGFDTDEEAIRIANDSRYGLYGGIHSRDPAKAWEMALKMRTGGVILNGGLFKQNDAPFGGYKRSGLGREYGDKWLDEYTHEKSIVFPVGV